VNKSDSRENMPQSSFGIDNLFYIDFKIDPALKCNHMVARSDANIVFMRLKFNNEGI